MDRRPDGAETTALDTDFLSNPVECLFTNPGTHGISDRRLFHLPAVGSVDPIPGGRQQ